MSTGKQDREGYTLLQRIKRKITPPHIQRQVSDSGLTPPHIQGQISDCIITSPNSQRRFSDSIIQFSNCNIQLQIRLDSLQRQVFDNAEDANLKQASWYQAGIPREIALEILQQEDVGAFIVRDSTTHIGCYALSVKVPKFDNPSGISHYLITRTSRGGYMLKGLDKQWPSLTALVIHHTVMPEMLPCTLRLPHNTPNPAYHDSEKGDDRDEDEDYQRLSDFSSMMADLKMGNS